MKLSSRNSAQACRKVPIQSPLPAKSGNHSRSSAVGLGADALDVVHHGEAERVGIEAAEAAVVEGGLEDHRGMGVQEFQHRAVGQLAALVQPVDDLVVHEGGAALVHHLGLALRIEILRQQAHDAQQLALPVLELGRILLQEVEQVLLGQAEPALLVLRLGWSRRVLSRVISGSVR